MRYALKHDVVWLDSLLAVDQDATILLLGGDGQLVPVPAPLLLAVSPLVRSILAEHLPPAYSHSCISLPSATEDVLKVVRTILATGQAADQHDSENRMEEVIQVFEILGVNALFVSCFSKSIDVGQIWNGKVENADEAVKVKTMSSGTEYFENVPPMSLKKELKISKVVNCSVFKDIDNVDATSAFEIKIEPDVNDTVQITKVVPHKCCECKYACYDKAELKTHYQTSHGNRKKFYCENCMYSCSNKGGLDYHCATTGHKAKKDAAACRQCDYIAINKEDLFKHKKKVHIPVGMLYECGECSWVDKQLHYLRDHAQSHGHKTKHDYEPAALARAEARGPKAVASYHKSLARIIKRTKKSHY